jgi:hypothetical protein
MTTQPKLTIILTTVPDFKQIEFLIKFYLINESISIIIFFDSVNESTLKRLDAMVLKNGYSGQVTFRVCDNAHWISLIGRQPANMPEKQHANLRLGAEIARRSGADWAISVDDDELIWPLSSLLEMLGRQDHRTDLLQLRSMEAVHSLYSAFSLKPFQAQFFRTSLDEKQYHKAMFDTNSLVIRYRHRLTDRFRKRGFLAHTNGKCAFRLNSPIDIWRQHKPSSSKAELKIVQQDAAFILHFDAINFYYWHKKWFRRTLGQTRATAIGDKRKILTNFIRTSMKLRYIGLSVLAFLYLYVFTKNELRKMAHAGVVEQIDLRSL